ncbi:MAG: hypothetical protein D4R88_04310 [Methanosarcinales archaeon]|nr:MAG: hypothetical protein D4R88_04310 [Methanosarcinales archaeon]
MKAINTAKTETSRRYMYLSVTTDISVEIATVGHTAMAADIKDKKRKGAEQLIQTFSMHKTSIQPNRIAGGIW